MAQLQSVTPARVLSQSEQVEMHPLAIGQCEEMVATPEASRLPP